MPYSTLLLGVQDQIATITLNRPEKRNAISPEMLLDIPAALAEVAAGPARVAILTGAGSAFCAGMDLEALRAMASQSPADQYQEVRRMDIDVEMDERTLREIYLPAFKAGLSEQLREVAAIAHNHEAPTFENTIVALERSGQLRTRVESVFSNLEACNGDPQMDRIDTEMAPKLAAQYDAIFLNEALWNRVDTLYRKRSTLHLDPESVQLLARYHTMFVRAGAQLKPDQQAHLRELNKQLSSLNTRFKQNVLKATTEGACFKTG